MPTIIYNTDIETSLGNLPSEWQTSPVYVEGDIPDHEALVVVVKKKEVDGDASALSDDENGTGGEIAGVTHTGILQGKVGTHGPIGLQMQKHAWSDFTHDMRDGGKYPHTLTAEGVDHIRKHLLPQDWHSVTIDNYDTVKKNEKECWWSKEGYTEIDQSRMRATPTATELQDISILDGNDQFIGKFQMQKTMDGKKMTVISSCFGTADAGVKSDGNEAFPKSIEGKDIKLVLTNDFTIKAWGLPAKVDLGDGMEPIFNKFEITALSIENIVRKINAEPDDAEKNRLTDDIGKIVGYNLTNDPPTKVGDCVVKLNLTDVMGAHILNYRLKLLDFIWGLNIQIFDYKILKWKDLWPFIKGNKTKNKRLNAIWMPFRDIPRPANEVTPDLKKETWILLIMKYLGDTATMDGAVINCIIKSQEDDSYRRKSSASSHDIFAITYGAKYSDFQIMGKNAGGGKATAMKGGALFSGGAAVVAPPPPLITWNVGFISYKEAWERRKSSIKLILSNIKTHINAQLSFLKPPWIEQSDNNEFNIVGNPYNKLKLSKKVINELTTWLNEKRENVNNAYTLFNNQNQDFWEGDWVNFDEFAKKLKFFFAIKDIFLENKSTKPYVILNTDCKKPNEDFIHTMSWGNETINVVTKLPQDPAELHAELYESLSKTRKNSTYEDIFSFSPDSGKDSSLGMYVRSGCVKKRARNPPKERGGATRAKKKGKMGGTEDASPPQTEMQVMSPDDAVVDTGGLQGGSMKRASRRPWQSESKSRDKSLYIESIKKLLGTNERSDNRLVWPPETKGEVTSMDVQTVTEENEYMPGSTSPILKQLLNECSPDQINSIAPDDHYYPIRNDSDVIEDRLELFNTIIKIRDKKRITSDTAKIIENKMNNDMSFFNKNDYFESFKIIRDITFEISMLDLFVNMRGFRERDLEDIKNKIYGAIIKRDTNAYFGTGESNTYICEIRFIEGIIKEMLEAGVDDRPRRFVRVPQLEQRRAAAAANVNKRDELGGITNRILMKKSKKKRKKKRKETRKKKSKKKRKKKRKETRKKKSKKKKSKKKKSKKKRKTRRKR